jgi:DNA-binding transcriptional LysR family regulator
VDLIVALRSFLRVAETGSFSAVAAERGITQPAISRQVSALEAHLGTRLVQRSTQAVTLTDEGRELVAAAQELVDAAEALLHSTARRRGKPVGRVRLAVPVALGLFLSSRFGRLLDQHEELSIDLVLRDEPGDLVEDGLDLELRLGPLDDSALISRHIGWTTACLVASPGYLGGRAPPAHPRDLEQHECIVYHRWGRDGVWWFSTVESDAAEPAGEIAVRVRGRFCANNAAAVHCAALDGRGIALLSHLCVAEDIRTGRLRRLLPRYPSRRFPLYVVYASRRSLPPRTRVVIDYLTELISEDPEMTLARAVETAP